VPRHGNRLSPRRYCLRAGLQARLRGNRVEAAGLTVSLGPLEALGEGQELGGTGSAARGGGGLEVLRRSVWRPGVTGAGSPSTRFEPRVIDVLLGAVQKDEVIRVTTIPHRQFGI
jgi:hypothetical protein